MNNLPDNFIEAEIILLNYFPFYAEMFIQTSFRINNDIPTMGIRFNKNLQIEVVYNENFVNSLSKVELVYLFCHEFNHVLFRHADRTKNRDKQVSNIAQDMIINTMLNRYESRLVDRSTMSIIMKMPKCGLVIPKEYDGDHVYEILYDWLLDTDPETGKSKSNGKSNTKDQKPSDGEGENGIDGEYQSNGLKQILEHSQQIKDLSDKIKTLDQHLDDEIDQDLKDQLVDELIDRARARGLVTMEMENILHQIRRKKKDYLREIKKYIAVMVGLRKHQTWTKPNRKELPIKGFKKYKVKLNVILDTSGSMNGNFEKVLSYVFQNDIEINLIQNDTMVKSVEKIGNKNELKKVLIKGLGGTTLQPAIDEVIKKYNKFSTLILTDGETDRLDVSKLKKGLIISCNVECPISNGKIKQIVIKEDNK